MMVGTDKFVKDASKLTVPLVWLGGILTVAFFIGAAGYQLHETTNRSFKNAEQNEKTYKKLETHIEDSVLIQVQQARMQTQLESIDNNVSEIKELLKKQ